ncbi:hypothetical protein C5S53_09730 [Methanophagales archaeon]|nr:hypothetical protein C5S53_09730 [Methanophagales archaeon]
MGKLNVMGISEDTLTEYQRHVQARYDKLHFDRHIHYLFSFFFSLPRTCKI